MKNYLLRFCIIVLCVFLIFPLSVAAHPGKTDYAGGHYDRNTGEYHYHHGYSAHSHYDMDGDGIIDCPYNFDDKTDHDSSNGTNSFGNPDINHNNNPDNKKNEISFWDVIKTIGKIIPLSLLTLFALSIVISILFVILESILDNVFKVKINEDKMKKIQIIFIAMSLAVSMVFEFIYLLYH